VKGQGKRRQSYRPRRRTVTPRQTATPIVGEDSPYRPDRPVERVRVPFFLALTRDSVAPPR
jgi:hypothetical protein